MGATAVAIRPAQAWWRGGPGWGYGGGVYLGFAPPVYVPPVYAPPVYAPPPVYYAPPPYYPPPAYPPPAYAAPSAAQGCYAGPYVCPLTVPVTIGGSCFCPAGAGRIYGRAG